MVRNLLQDVDGHVEVVVLHGGGGVNGRQRGSDINHELVVETSVVQVVTERTNKHREALKNIVGDNFSFKKSN